MHPTPRTARARGGRAALPAALRAEGEARASAPARSRAVRSLPCATASRTYRARRVSPFGNTHTTRPARLRKIAEQPAERSPEGSFSVVVTRTVRGHHGEGCPGAVLPLQQHDLMIDGPRSGTPTTFEELLPAGRPDLADA